MAVYGICKCGLPIGNDADEVGWLHDAPMTSDLTVEELEEADGNHPAVPVRLMGDYKDWEYETT